jgi:hypothetical protein
VVFPQADKPRHGIVADPRPLDLDEQDSRHRGPVFLRAGNAILRAAALADFRVGRKRIDAVFRMVTQMQIMRPVIE